MFFHSILSALLLLLPIAVTVGVYIGIEFQKIFHGGFTGVYGVLEPSTGAGTSAPDPADGIQTNIYCQKSYGITPKGSRYTYNPNQWSLTAADASRMCLKLTTGTIIEGAYDADPWSITWNYTQGDIDQPVHAFANAELTKSNLPAMVSAITQIPLDVTWTYGIGNSNTTNDNRATLSDADVNTNVAVDMFFDSDKTASEENTKAAHEVMVWLGSFGISTQPIGYGNTSLETKTVGGTVFKLYGGQNAQKQNVWTWVAGAPANTFTGDLLPLVTVLESHNGPSASDYMGYIAFGSEAYWSPVNATMSVTKLSIDVEV